MLTGKVTRLGRKNSSILTALLLALMFQAGAAEAEGKKLTVRIDQILDGAGQPVKAGKATVGREDGGGEKTTQDFSEGRLEHTRNFAVVNYVIELAAETAEGQKLGAKVTLPAGEIQKLGEGGVYEVKEPVHMAAAGLAQPGASPLPGGTPQPANTATPTPTPTPTLEEDVRGLRAVVAEQGKTLQALDFWLKLATGLLGLLALVALAGAARGLLRGGAESLYERQVKLELEQIRKEVGAIRLSAPATIKESVAAALVSAEGLLGGGGGGSRESQAPQSLGDPRGEFSTPPDGFEEARQADAKAREGEATGGAQSSLHENAVQAYKSLVQGNQTSLPAVYVNADVTGGPDDALGGGGPVTLRQTHSGGAYVLFADGNEGFVFPNPKLPFSPALRPVFPHLSRPDFEDSKESIPPARARRSGDGWKAEAAS